MKTFILIIVFALTAISTFGQQKTDERQVEYRDGTPWQYYLDNGLKIALTNTIMRSYGKWHKVDIIIFNDSDSLIEIDPENNITAYSIDKDGIKTVLEVWSSEKYTKKVKRAQMWTMAAVGFSEGLSTANAGYSTAYHYSPNSGYTYSTTYNASEAYQAQVTSQNRIANLSVAMVNEQNSKQMGYLKRNTIYPGEIIQGYINIERVSGDVVHITFNVNDTEYAFEWQFGNRNSNNKKQ